MKYTVPSRLGGVTPPNGLDTLQDLGRGYKAYKAVTVALDLGLFDWLEEKKRAHKEDFVQGLGINGALCRSFLHTLEELGFLLKEEENFFRNSPRASELFVRSSPAYQGDWFTAWGSPESRWSSLGETLQLQEPVLREFSSGPGESFICSLGQRLLQGELQEIVRVVTSWEHFSEARSVLDLGGGHGLLGMALCQENPEMNMVLFDKPHVVPYAQPYIEGAGLENRVVLRGGDAMTEDLEGPFDIILVSHVLYKFRKELPSFFERLGKALVPGGLFVSNHWFCNPGCAPGKGLQDLEQGLHSFGHPLCHVEDFPRLLEQAGLMPLGEAVPVSGSFGTSLLHRACRKGTFEIVREGEKI
ncbi:MAG TPA: methyltransferase [Synergistaceae bacterium]|nr:methyltransferase [Synergistaceae bacterium]